MMTGRRRRRGRKTFCLFPKFLWLADISCARCLVRRNTPTKTKKGAGFKSSARLVVSSTVDATYIDSLGKKAVDSLKTTARWRASTWKRASMKTTTTTTKVTTGKTMKIKRRIKKKQKQTAIYRRTQNLRVRRRTVSRTKVKRVTKRRRDWLSKRGAIVKTSSLLKLPNGFVRRLNW